MKERIYHRLAEFCAVRNEGSTYRNGTRPTPRVRWILDLLEELGIEYELDEWCLSSDRRAWNIYLHSVEKGSPLALMAHHDIVNPNSENANDNSASVINAIAAKLERPELTVVLTDGEEVGGIGAARYARLVLARLLPRPIWVLNLELTGRGGKSYFIGDDTEGPLKRYLLDNEVTTVSVPFNDSVVLRRHGIDSVVINPLPLDEHGEFELWRLRRCHSPEDTVSEVSFADMQEFVEGVLLPIVDGWPRPKTGFWARLLARFRRK